MSRAVIRQALGFIESHSKYWNGSADHPQTIVEELRAELANSEQSAFETWLAEKCPSGDIESVHSQWLESSEYKDLVAP